MVGQIHRLEYYYENDSGEKIVDIEVEIVLDKEQIASVDHVSDITNSIAEELYYKLVNIVES